MGFITHCSTVSPSSAVGPDLSAFPPPASAFWPRTLCRPPHPPALPPSRLGSLAPSSPPPAPPPAVLSACPARSLLGLDKDEKQRSVLTEARSCEKEGGRLPNLFRTTKGAQTPEAGAKVGRGKVATVTPSLGRVLSCPLGRSQRFYQAARYGLFTSRSPHPPPPRKCRTPVLLHGYSRNHYSPEFWEGQEEKGD